MILSKLCGVTALLVCVAAPGESSSSLCEAPVVKKHARGECETYSVPYRDGEQFSQVDVATIDSGWKGDGDTVYPIQRSYIRLPDGEIKRVRSIPGFPYVLDGSLGFGRETVDKALVYEYQAFERVGRRFCSVGVAKYPFEGRVEYCEGRTKPKGEIHLSAGVISPEAVRQLLCADIQTLGCRGLGGLKLVRDEGAQFVYRAEARIEAGELVRGSIDLADKRPFRTFGPVVYELRSYAVSLDGALNLRTKSKLVCDRDCEAVKEEEAGSVGVSAE